MRILLVFLILGLLGTGGVNAENTPARPTNFIEPQRGPVWCWACTTSNLLAQYGKTVSQEQIVIQTFGRIVHSGGTQQMCMNAIRKQGLTPIRTGSPLSESQARSLLSNGRRLMVFAFPGGSGHVLMLQGVTANGFVLADPMGGRTQVVSYQRLRAINWHDTIYIDSPASHEFERSGKLVAVGPKAAPPTPIPPAAPVPGPIPHAPGPHTLPPAPAVPVGPEIVLISPMAPSTHTTNTSFGQQRM